MPARELRNWPELFLIIVLPICNCQAAKSDGHPAPTLHSAAEHTSARIHQRLNKTIDDEDGDDDSQEEPGDAQAGTGGADRCEVAEDPRESGAMVQLSGS